MKQQKRSEMIADLNNFYDSIIRQFKTALLRRYQTRQGLQSDHIDLLEKRLKRKIRNPVHLFDDIRKDFFKDFFIDEEYTIDNQVTKEKKQQQEQKHQQKLINNNKKPININNTNQSQKTQLKPRQQQQEQIIRFIATQQTTFKQQQEQQSDMSDDLAKFHPNNNSTNPHKSQQQQQQSKSKTDQKYIQIPKQQQSQNSQDNKQQQYRNTIFKRAQNCAHMHIVGTYSTKQKKHIARYEKTKIELENVFIKVNKTSKQQVGSQMYFSKVGFQLSKVEGESLMKSFQNK